MKTVVLFIFCFCFMIPAFAKVELWEPHFQAHPLLAKRIQEWIASLQNQDQSSIILENFKQVGSIVYPHLKDALEKGDEKLQKKIIELLAQLKIKESIGLLCGILQKESVDPRVRESAAIALGEFSSIEISEVLIKFAFHRDNRIFPAASYALCKKPTRQNIPYFILLLKHWDDNIRSKAHTALARITGQSSIPSDYVSWQRWWTNYQDIFEDTNK